MGQIGINAITTTISSGQSLSAPVPTGDRVPVGLMMSAGWDAAVLTFQVSTDGGQNYGELTDSSGNAVSWTVAAGRYIPFDPSVWIGINMFKIRSGTSGAAVNQTVDRILTVVARY